MILKLKPKIASESGEWVDHATGSSTRFPERSSHTTRLEFIEMNECLLNIIFLVREVSWCADQVVIQQMHDTAQLLAHQHISKWSHHQGSDDSSADYST